MKNKKNEIEKNSLNRMSDIFSLPKDVVMAAMVVKITGCNEIVVENYCSISEYNQCKLRLMGKNSKLTIIGKALVIVHFSDKSIIVRGRINEVKFI